MAKKKIKQKPKHRRPVKKGLSGFDKLCASGAVTGILLCLVSVGQVQTVTPGDAGTLKRAERSASYEAEEEQTLMYKGKPVMSLSVKEFAYFAAEQAGIDGDIFWGLILTESGGNPKVGCSKAGACGLGQLMPATAKELGVDRHDWRQNLIGSAFYLAKKIREKGDLNLGIASYNAGGGRIDGWVKAGAHFEHLPDETQRYIGKVHINASKVRREYQVAGVR